MPMITVQEASLTFLTCESSTDQTDVRVSLAVGIVSAIPGLSSPIAKAPVPRQVLVFVVNHFMASAREVKKRLGRVVLFIAKTKLAMTLSTGEAPRRAIGDAWQASAKMLRAPRLTDFVVAMSTSSGRSV